MILNNVITLLRQELPKYTTKFNATVNISSLSFSAGTVTAVTSTEHGLVTGDKVTITQAFQKTPITSITTDTNGIATVITSIDNDITKDYYNELLQPQIEITGCSVAAYNNSFNLTAGIDSTTFKLNIGSDPADASDGYVLEPSYYGYNGVKTVTVVDSTTFTYSATGLAPAAQGGIVNSDYRITGAVEPEVAAKSYSKQLNDNYWLFVTPAGVTPSKSRSVTSDATDTVTAGNEYRQQILSSFNIYVFIPSKNDIAGRASYDAAYSLASPICRSLLNSTIENPFTSETYGNTIFEGHDFFAYADQYYVHEYKFSTQFDLVQSDTINLNNSVAFRKFDLWYNNDNDEIIMSTNNVEV